MAPDRTPDRSGPGASTVLAVSTGILLLFGCGRDLPRPSAKLHQVARTDLADNLSLSGFLDSDHKVQLKSEVSGTVKSILRSEGDRLRKGDTILVIDPLQLKIRLERDQLALSRSRIQLQQAQRNHRDAVRLAESGGISAHQLQDLAWSAELARIKWQEDGSAVAETRYLLGKSAIVSPMDGVLISLEAREGEVIVSGTASLGGGTELGAVADLDRMGVDVGISELDYPHVHPGQRAIVATEADPERKLQGRISFLSTEAKEMGDRNVRFFRARISLDSLDRKMAPGMNVSVSLQVLSLSQVLAAPSDMIHSVPGAASKYVWLIQGDTPRRTAVGVGRTNFIESEILSGLSEGDWIASDSVASAIPTPAGTKAGAAVAERPD